MAFATALSFVSLVHQTVLAQSSRANAESVAHSGNSEKSPAVGTKPKSKIVPVGANETTKLSPKQVPKRQPILVEPEVEPDYNPQQQVKTSAAKAKRETRLQPKPHVEAKIEETPKRRSALKRTISADAESDPSYVKPTLEYDEIIDPSKRRAISSTIASEFALRADRVERAIQLARRSIKQFPDDMDAHKALAEALDRKLELQVEKDPTLFEECIKEWLVIMRNGVGFEKGINFRGIGIFDHAYGDDEYYEVAKHRIKHLTGYIPKPWESNDRFLRKVLRPAKTELKGKILTKPTVDE